MESDPSVRDALAALGSAGSDRLRLGSEDAAALAERHGTPLYAYDLAVARERVAEVRAALGPDIELYYSLKANPHPRLVACLRACGAGGEVASAGELRAAVEAGHGPGEVLFAGPGKTPVEIALGIEHGVVFHLESASEARDVADAASAERAVAAVAVRVNPDAPVSGSRMRMGGGSSVFGVDAEQVPGLLRWIAEQPSLRLRGLHVYAGTQCFDAEAWLHNARRLLERGAEWERDLGLELPWFDLGGGFGVPSFRGDPVFDLEAAGSGLRALLTEHARGGRRFAVELGRFLVAPAGVYLARVLRVKESRGTRRAILDGGLNHCAFAAGLGAVLKRPPLLVHSGRLRDPDLEPLFVHGPLCTPLDSFGEVHLPRVEEGDLLAVLHAGAYGLTYSPTGFLSHPPPAEIVVDQTS